MNTPGFLNDFQKEWRQNTRLRLGGWLVLVILAVYGLMLLSDVRRSIEKDYTMLAERWQRLETISREQTWQERAAAARTLRIQLEGRFWRAESRGMAQANLQTWIDGVLQKLRFAEVKVQVEDPLDIQGYPGIWQVAVRVEAPFDFQKMARLLWALETNSQLISVEELEVRRTRKQARLTLTFKAYYRPSAS